MTKRKSTRSGRHWKAYERAAERVIADLRHELGVATVEGKQTLKGVSGTEWEIDAKAWLAGGEGFLVVEARRHTRAGLTQEEVAGVAYRIADVAAKGGFTVAPRRLQKGGALIAAHANITHVKLDPASTTESYLAEFMGRAFHGASITESLSPTDSQDATVTRGGKSRE